MHKAFNCSKTSFTAINMTKRKAEKFTLPYGVGDQGQLYGKGLCVCRSS